MKRNSFFLVMLIIAFSLGMVLINCDADGGTTTYTVTFESNGGSTVPAISGILYGTTITLPSVPTKGTDTFGGWFTDNGTFLNEFTASTVVIEDVTVYAKWTSPYAGVWISSSPQNKITIADDLTFILENNPESGYVNIEKGYIVIDGTTITLTITHGWHNSQWSNDQGVLDGLLSFNGGSLTVNGTITGSDTGSTLTTEIAFVKQ